MKRTILSSSQTRVSSLRLSFLIIMIMMVMKQTSAFGQYNTSNNHSHRRNANRIIRKTDSGHFTNDIPLQNLQHCERFQQTVSGPSTNPITKSFLFSINKNDSSSLRQISLSSVSIGFLPQAGSLMVSILIVNVIRSILYSKSHPNEVK